MIDIPCFRRLEICGWRSGLPSEHEEVALGVLLGVG